MEENKEKMSETVLGFAASNDIELTPEIKEFAKAKEKKKKDSLSYYQESFKG